MRKNVLKTLDVLGRITGYVGNEDSVTYAYDASGNITDTFKYDTYGNVISRIGSSNVIFGYLNHQEAT